MCITVWKWNTWTFTSCSGREWVRVQKQDTRKQTRRIQTPNSPILFGVMSRADLESVKRSNLGEIYVICLSVHSNIYPVSYPQKEKGEKTTLHTVGKISSLQGIDHILILLLYADKSRRIMAILWSRSICSA